MKSVSKVHPQIQGVGDNEFESQGEGNLVQRGSLVIIVYCGSIILLFLSFLS